MKIFLNISAVVAAGLLFSAKADAQAIYPAIKGELVSLKGKSVQRFDDSTISGAKYFGIYYSASWCGPCKAFTPKLVEFYNRIKPKNPQFELIFVSHDNSAKEMEAYMHMDQMPWPALAYNKIRSEKQLAAYCGPGIPCLVFVDAEGKVLSDSFVGKTYVGPYKVMEEIEKTLSANPAAAAGASATAPAKPAAGPSDFDGLFKKK